MKRKWLWLSVPLMMAVALIPLSRKQREFIHLFELVPGTEGCAMLSDSMWISPHEVVCARTGEPSSREFAAGVGGAPLEAINVTSGRARKLGDAPRHHQINGTWGISVSPDGKWILWPGMVYHPASDLYGEARWNAMTLDGKQFVQRPRVADSISSRGLAWLADSSGWVEACVTNRARNGRTNGVTLRVCSLNSNAVKKIDVPQAKNANNTFAVTRAGAAIIGCDGPNGLLLVTQPLFGSGLVRSHNVRLPARLGKGRILARSLISPRGDRITWKIEDTAALTTSLWLSDIKGSKFESLTLGSDKGSDALEKLHWNSDGKSLSFWRPTPGSKTGAKSLYRINIPQSLSLKP